MMCLLSLWELNCRYFGINLLIGRLAGQTSRIINMILEVLFVPVCNLFFSSTHILYHTYLFCTSQYCNVGSVYIHLAQSYCDSAMLALSGSVCTQILPQLALLVPSNVFIHTFNEWWEIVSHCVYVESFLVSLHNPSTKSCVTILIKLLNFLFEFLYHP